MLLKEQVIVVSGVANNKSLSWGIARALHREGARLIFTYRRDKSLRKLTKLLQDQGIEPLLVTQCDMLDDESITQAFQEIEKHVDSIQGFVHSIAFADTEALNGEFVDTTRESYLLTQNICSYSLVVTARHARRLMKEGGSIVTQTYTGSGRVVKNYNVMGVAKASLEASVRYLAEDLGKYGIRINAVSSGPVLTSASSAITDLKDKLFLVEERAPLRRNITQDDVGDATMFLLSRLARGITGEILHVDAGFHVLSM